MTQKLWRFTKHSWFWLAILLAIFALLLSILRLGLYFSDDFRDNINTYLNENTQLNIEIGGLDAKFHNFKPVLVLRDTRLQFEQGSHNSVTIGAVLIELDLWQSIDQRKLQIRDLVLDNLSLDFDPRHMDAMLNSPEKNPSAKSDSSITSLFLNQLQSFTLNNAHLNITTPAHSFTLLIPQLGWKNEGTQHRGQGGLQLFGQGHEGELKLNIELDSSHPDGGITARWYIDAEHLNIASLIGERAELVARQLRSDLNFSVWGSIGSAEQSGVQMLWQPSRFTWQDQQQLEHQLKLDSAYMQSVRVADERWQLDSEQFVLHHSDSNNVRAISQELKLQGLFEKERFKLHLAQIDIPFMAALIDLFDAGETQWSNYIESGEIKSLQLGFDTASNDWGYALQVDGLSTNQHSVLPMLQSLDLDLTGDNEGLDLHVRLPTGQLKLGEFFEQPWQLSSAQAHVSLLFSNQPQLLVHQFALDTQELNLEGSARLLWDENKALPHMSLLANLDLRDASRVELYYPKVMPKEVHTYLAGAIESGNAQDAQVLWYGDLAGFPYAANDGMFQAMLPLRQAQFRFDPQWDALSQLDLDLLFQNDSLFMSSESAHLGYAKAERILATISPLTGDVPLYVEANVVGQSHKVSDYLLESPLTGLANTLRQLRLKDGIVKGVLELSIPLNGKQDVTAKGQVEFNDVDVHIATLSQTIAAVDGRVSFDNSVVKGTKLQGQWNELPLNFEFSSLQSGSNNESQITLDGRWPVTKISKALGSDLTSFYDGELEWKGQIDISLPQSGDFEYSASFNSDLLGLGSTLPLPLAKTRAQKWPSVLRVSGTDKGSQLLWQSPNRYQLNARLSHQKGLSVESMHLQLGELLQARSDPGIAIDLRYPNVDAEPWFELASSSWTSKKPASLQAKPASLIAFPTLVYLRADVDQVSLKGQKVNDFVFEYYPRSTTPIRVQSKELMLSAKIPQQVSRETPISVAIERALLGDMQFAQADPNESLLESQSHRLSAEQVRAIRKSISSIRIDCKSCEIGRFKLGKVAINIPERKGVIEHATIEITQPENQLTLDFDWYQRSQGKEYTRMRVDLKSESFESLIRSFGINSPILNTPATLIANVSWDDAPFQPKLSSLSGYAKFDGQQGTFTEVDDKGSRWLAIASLETVRRRLQLDFTDVFDKGLHYDTLSASFKAKDGLVDNQDFFLNGGAGNLRGQGSLDFQSGLVDYRVSFSPNLTTSVAVVTAFVATPITGVAVYALSKLFEPVVDVVTRIDFQLSGNIEQPDLIESKRVQEPMNIPRDMVEALKRTGQ